MDRPHLSILLIRIFAALLNMQRGKMRDMTFADAISIILPLNNTVSALMGVLFCLLHTRFAAR